MTQLGRVVSIQGPIVEVKFDRSSVLPSIHEIIETDTYDGQKVVMEVEEQLENYTVKCIALSATMNVPRNASATALGTPVEVPVGKELFGRVVNVMGEPIDRKGDIEARVRLPIRRKVASLNFGADDGHRDGYEILETGVKMIDLLYPLVKGSKSGILGGAALGK
ncbi:MAG: F0F1 ATP synthase subunit beta, partial [Candidatus Binatia bacterium]